MIWVCSIYFHCMDDVLSHFAYEIILGVFLYMPLFSLKLLPYEQQLGQRVSVF